MEYEVVITLSALRDLEEIRIFIARDNPSVAETFIEKLLDGAEALSTFPERGGCVTQRPGARFVIVQPYLIIYRIMEQSRTVRVLRYWHGARERMRL
ncbi:MAG: type II toxin-antitoxin system RelE/ParE family toxin [Chthoniobacterales bacterium]